jgi:hypothetical protein
MKRDRISLETGDSVKVKDRMMCPDMEDLCIEGWQGKVSETGEDKDGDALISMRCSITLKKLPDYFIEQNEEEGLDYTRMYLRPEDAEPVECRDSEEDAADW